MKVALLLLLTLIFLAASALAIRASLQTRVVHGQVRGRTLDWAKAAVLVGILGSVFGVATNAVLAMDDKKEPPRQESTTPAAWPSPSEQRPSAAGASPQEQTVALQRLHDAANVGLFTDVLGPAGYKSASVTLPTGVGELPSPKYREWAWAINGRYLVRAMVDDDDVVQAYALTTLSPQVQPLIPYLSEGANGPLRLGVATFADVVLRPVDTGTTLAPIGRDAAFPANGTFSYEEEFQAGNSLYRGFALAAGFIGRWGDDDLQKAVFDVAYDLRPCPDDQQTLCLRQPAHPKVLEKLRTRQAVTTVVVTSQDVAIADVIRVLPAMPTDEDVRAASR